MGTYVIVAFGAFNVHMRRSLHAATLFQYLKNLREAAVMTDVPLRTW